MALFTKSETSAQTTSAQTTTAAFANAAPEPRAAEKQLQEVPAFLAKDGTEDDGGYVPSGTAYLSIAQSLSNCVTGGLCSPGNWFNSGTQQSMGQNVTVVPLYAKTFWDEKEEGGKTVARYEPYSIETVKKPNPQNPRYPILEHPVTKNKIVEVPSVVVVFPDFPEAGCAVFNVSRSSIRQFNQWARAFKGMVLPNGKPARIFSKMWQLTIGDTPVPNKVGAPSFVLEAFQDLGFINQDTYEKCVLPVIELASQIVLPAPAETDE